MVIKVDLEKAYDKLEWSFIREMLIRINRSQNMIQLIMSCVTFVSTSILWVILYRHIFSLFVWIYWVI